jgi:small subunit ribosomal protein S17
MSAKKFVGQVVSNSMVSTVVVSIDASRRHPIYKKMIKLTKKLKAHTTDKYQVGDVVEIVETRPFSKQVAFKVVGKVTK